MNEPNGDIIYRYRKEINQDLAREAEKYRLEREALSASSARSSWLKRLLNWVGQTMIELGLSIQNRAADRPSLADPGET